MQKVILYGSTKGEDNKNLSVITPSESCSVLSNFFNYGEGRMKLRYGLRKLFTAPEKISFYTKYDDTYSIIAHGNSVSKLTNANYTITAIKEDFATDDEFSGEKYDDSVYLCNKGNKIGFVDNSFVWNEISGAPKARILRIHNQRMYAGDTDTHESEIKASEYDTGSATPFTNWTASDNANAPQTWMNKNFGKVNGIGFVGDMVIGGYDKGRAGLHHDIVDVGTSGLKQVAKLDFQNIDFGSQKGLITTPYGVVYVNEFGVFVISGGKDNYTNEVRISDMLKDELTKINFDNADIEFLPIENKVIITCKRRSDKNNHILLYDFDEKAWSRITGWNIERFYREGNTLYGTSSINGDFFELFSGYDDNGVGIYGEWHTSWINLGDSAELKSMYDFFIATKQSYGQELKVYIDVFDRNNTEIPSIKTITCETMYNETGGFYGIGQMAIGGTDLLFDENYDEDQVFDTMRGEKSKIKKFSKIRFRIEGNFTAPIEINSISFQYYPDGRIKNL